MTRYTYMLVAGARPNFMKVAPLRRAFAARRDARFEVLLVHTGQHCTKNMSDDFFRDLGMPAPHIDLGVGSGSHAEQTARVMVAFEAACPDHRPDCLRSRDMSMPEEINRLCTDAISDLLFTTDRGSVKNVRDVGIPARRIHFAGNVMIDTLRQQLGRALETPLPDGAAPGSYAVVTLHRPANVDDPSRLADILGAVNEVAQRIPIFFPAHPRVAASLAAFPFHPNVRVTEPLSYLPFLGLVARCRMVLTDSGGIQEETTALGVPCLMMRANTQRPITCEVGTNVLVALDPRRIVAEANAVLDGRQRRGTLPERWDGRAAERIVDVHLRDVAPACGADAAAAQEAANLTA